MHLCKMHSDSILENLSPGNEKAQKKTMSSSWMETPDSRPPLQMWRGKREQKLSLAIVRVANLQIPARGGNRSSTLLLGAREMGVHLTAKFSFSLTASIKQDPTFAGSVIETL